ncbi:Gfo/Idh/MocA family oxidoreductase [Ornithinimicrobium faecis]|uniref:Gfo/Idh/MocA family oxidoreductase n=1 Tax=Ornithinimicrobium faecis TaxID=2934158 RepID=A0ABY4YTC2_9MICO|nr:Gfo/Idh/MocA family oxidoreductase [Ornithinimicrobium sp. HY1793]USQ80017.1 Gfo/Idh/MocA family oxidoreductase [Ornithinimicrobium sp. HY1793]
MTISTALVGFGLGGRIFHAPFLAADPDFTIAAIVTSDPERAEAARAEHPGARIVPDLDTLLGLAPELDLQLGVVSTPPVRHAEQASALLEAGFHVVVDKPLTVTAEEGHALLALAERVGRTVIPFQNRRWDGDFRTLRELVETGQLGEVRRLESRFERWKPTETKAWKAGATGTGVGVLYDLGVHLIDQAVHLLGPVEDLYAEVRALRPGQGADDDTFVALQHAGGAISHLWMSAVAPQQGPRFRVLGDRAGFTAYGLDPLEGQLVAGARPGQEGFGQREQDRDALVGVHGEDERRVPLLPGDYGAFYRGVAQTLTTGAQPPVDPRDSLAVIELIERIHRDAGQAQVG